jgi:hypothetical protein
VPSLDIHKSKLIVAKIQFVNFDKTFFLFVQSFKKILEKFFFHKGNHFEDTSVTPNALTKHFPQTTRMSDFSQ